MGQDGNKLHHRLERDSYDGFFQLEGGGCRDDDGAVFVLGRCPGRTGTPIADALDDIPPPPPPGLYIDDLSRSPASPYALLVPQPFPPPP